MNKKLLTLTAVALTASLANLAHAQDAMMMGKDAYVRVVHASPDAPNVDVYVDGMRTVTNAAFKAVTSFGEVPAGSHKVMVTVAGDKSKAVLEATLNLKAGTYYTVAATGLVKDLKASVFTSAKLNSNKAKAEVNVYHLAPGGPKVNALAVDMMNAPILKYGVSYGHKATVLVNPMGVNLNIVPFGKTTPVVKNLTGISVAGGKSYSVFAVGVVGGTGMQAFDLVVAEDKLVSGSMKGQ